MNKVDQGGEGTCSDQANVRGLSGVLMEPEGAVERKTSFIVTSYSNVSTFHWGY